MADLDTTKANVALVGCSRTRKTRSIDFFFRADHRHRFLDNEHRITINTCSGSRRRRIRLRFSGSSFFRRTQ
jgi:hypothetical protein